MESRPAGETKKKFDKKKELESISARSAGGTAKACCHIGVLGNWPGSSVIRKTLEEPAAGTTPAGRNEEWGGQQESQGREARQGGVAGPAFIRREGRAADNRHDNCVEKGGRQFRRGRTTEKKEQSTNPSREESGGNLLVRESSLTKELATASLGTKKKKSKKRWRQCAWGEDQNYPNHCRPSESARRFPTCRPITSRGGESPQT